MKKNKREYRLIRTVDGDIEIEQKFLWFFWFRVRNKQGVVEYFIDKQSAYDYLRELERKTYLKEEVVGHYTIN